MNDIIFTKHAITRMNQRSVNFDVVSLLIEYGETRNCRGNAISFYFSRWSLQQILNDHGRECLKKCEKFKNAYAVVAEGGSLVTVARSYRKTIH